MKRIKIPKSVDEAEALVDGCDGDLSLLTHSAFVEVWAAIAYLNPGLHPDGFSHEDSGWPEGLKRFAEEAWRREEIGLQADDELYPAEAALAGVAGSR